jgi:hypothetical protein
MRTGAVLLLILTMVACESTSRVVVYSDHNYAELEKGTDITVKFTDGRVARFHRMKIVRVDEQHIYARCWERKDSEPKDFKFLKSEIVIEDTEFSTPNTVGYVLSFALMVGILYLLQRIIYD